MSFKSSIVNRQSSINGFTLLEVMIALSIISATLVVSLYTINYHADVSFENTIKTRMLLLAKEELRMLEISRKKSKGTIEETEYSYENNIRKTGFNEIIQLVTIIKDDSRELTLSKLVLKNGGEDIE